MKLLIFGGTQFVGRHIAETALAHGHEVSLFHRGQTGPGLHPQAEHILGDRKGELSVIGDRRFDAVIDVSGYLPQVVHKSVEFTRNLTNHYLFISTISVYDAEGMSQVDEATPLLVPPAEEVDVVTNETYGGLKVACEAAVRSAFPGATILRPGLVGARTTTRNGLTGGFRPRSATTKSASPPIPIARFSWSTAGIWPNLH